MTLDQLVKMDMGAAIDWLTANLGSFELVPIEPTREMREAFNESYEQFEEGFGTSPDSQWGAMITAHRQQSNG